MSDIVVVMKDGTRKEFIDRGAPGGSYANSIRYEGAFAIVEDAYGNRTAIPAADIQELRHATERRGW